MADDEQLTLRKLRWQCRRGMRELDVLLDHWLQNHYAVSSKSQKAAFSALLALPDPELAGYLLQGRETSSREAAGVIAQIRGQHPPGPGT